MLATRLFFWWDTVVVDPMTPVRTVPASDRVFDLSATPRVFSIEATDRVFDVPVERL